MFCSAQADIAPMRLNTETHTLEPTCVSITTIASDVRIGIYYIYIYIVSLPLNAWHAWHIRCARTLKSCKSGQTNA